MYRRASRSFAASELNAISCEPGARSTRANQSVFAATRRGRSRTKEAAPNGALPV